MNQERVMKKIPILLRASHLFELCPWSRLGPRDLKAAQILLFGSGHSITFLNDHPISLLQVMGFLLSFLSD